MRPISFRSLLIASLLVSTPALARHPVTHDDAARVEAEEQAAAQATKDHHRPVSRTAEKPRHGRDIVQALKAAGKYRTLLTALKVAGMLDTLEQNGPYTIFAPTDAAFRRIPHRKLRALLRNADKLKDILQYHVVNGAMRYAELRKMPNGSKLDTLGDDSLTLSVRHRRVTVGRRARLSARTVNASNGVIYAINVVLMPSSR